jgi:hypothetical protein
MISAELEHYTCMVKLPEICIPVSRPFNLLSTCSKNNLGVSLNFEKAHSKLQKNHQVQKKPMKRENEGKRWGALGSLWKKRKKTHTQRGQSDFLGQFFGQTKRNHSGLGIFKKFVGSLKLFRQSTGVKWTWQFGKIVMLSWQFGNADLVMLP